MRFSINEGKNRTIRQPSADSEGNPVIPENPFRREKERRNYGKKVQ